MAFDQSTRNRLQHFVSDAKTLLIVEFTRQLQNEYGLNPETGEVSDLSNLSFLDDARRETAGILRETMEHYLATTPGAGNREVLSRIVWEQAFTILNRMAALRMAEARGILMESIGNGYQSKGFQLYSYVAKSALGESGDAYRHYIFSIFDEFSLDLKVLFDRFSPQGRLFPKESKLMELLDLINHPDIEHLWAEDETIGWIYQYFNSKEERKKMRDASQAPRNSRELAVRNQFFTPRYVVEFLTDNTLGRIWYEMTQGKTSLIESCRYLVRRPNEFFLNKGENASEPEEGEGHEELSQEELLKQPVHVTFRQIKDPRDLKMLDPACGSMHFGLYAFDLFEKIYDEAWDIEGELGAGHFQQNKTFNPLHESYENKEFFLQDVPRLIIENNIHGVDIDPRAVQIAGLSLWLRAQKSWHEMGITAANRPQIQKSNIVCAEPMPGEENLLKEFTANLKPRVIGQLVEIIFEKMKLAGEAGSLLKIEEEIQDAIKEAREEYSQEVLQKKGQKGFLPGMAPTRQPTLFDFADLPDDEAFWDQAENKILDALRDYAEHAEGGNTSQKRLFAQDAAKGFAFIDLCRKRFDIVLMNPPFGEFCISFKKQAKKYYEDSYNDILASFVDCYISKMTHRGRLGAITSRTCFFLSSYQKWRSNIILTQAKPVLFADLGHGVMDDAMVEAAAYCLEYNSNTNSSTFVRLLESKNKESVLLSSIMSICADKRDSNVYIMNPNLFLTVPSAPFAYWVSNNVRNLFRELPPFEDTGRTMKQGIATADDFRFLRLWCEVIPERMLDCSERNDWNSDVAEFQRWCIHQTYEDKYWAIFAKGGEYSPFFLDIPLVVNWNKDGKEIKNFCNLKTGKIRSRPQNLDLAFRPGITWSDRTTSLFSARQWHAGGIFSIKGSAGFFRKNKPLVMGLMNSTLFNGLISLIVGAGEAAAKSYQVGTIGHVPFPILEGKTEEVNKISELSLFITKSKRIISDNLEFSRTFNGMCINKQSLKECHFEFNNRFEKLVKNITDAERTIDKLVYYIYDLPIEDQIFFNKLIRGNSDSLCMIEKTNQALNPFVSIVEFTTSILSYFIGFIFGRWDIRHIAGERENSELYSPFAPLPKRSPAMLQNGETFENNIEDQLDIYPISVCTSGILVDDKENPDDLIASLQEIMTVIWKGDSQDIDQEVCQIMGIASLREYISKPSKFFSDHLKCYSKSRRQAPIYWPLSTTSGSYTLWLYYHRITDQILYTCINNFVEPKLKQISDNVEPLRQKINRSNQEEKDIEKLTNLELELTDFRDELLRIAKFWKPNLNDGVHITAAPLWKLFQYKPWQNKLKETWGKLEKGEYDWAHLAHSIWPERVREKCKTDKSLAIAHDLEDLYEEPPEKPKKKRRKKSPAKG